MDDKTVNTKTWYRVSKYSKEISEIQAIRETKKCIYIKDGYKGERKLLKSSSYEFLFDTFEKALEKLKDLKILDKKKEKNERILQFSKQMYLLIKSIDKDGLSPIDLAEIRQIIIEIEL